MSQETRIVQTSNLDKVFYVPGGHVIDYAEDCGGVLRSICLRETLEQVQERYPHAIVGDAETVYREMESSYISDPVRITEDDFDYALNVLPPMNWVRSGSVQSFKMSEFTSGRITAIYAQFGDEYWKFSDRYTLSHSEIMERVIKASKQADQG